MTTTFSATRLSDLLTSKVPQVTLAFWIIKVFSTTVGETAADFLNADLGLGLTLTAIVTTLLLSVALIVQFRTRRYMPVAYWTAIVLISIVGTLITDILTDVFAVPLWLTTAAFTALLAATFLVWHRREGTLSIHSIVTPRREAYYWLAILFTFALGTAAGDLISESLGLGYAVAALVFAVAITIIGVAYVAFRADAVVCFWAAYVLTRPLGASLGDLVSQPTTVGGFGWGTTGTSAVFLIVIVGLVTAMSISLASHRRELATSSN